MALFAAVILQAGVGVAVPAQSVRGVSFSDATHGYLAGGYSGDDGVVAYTADGGLSWRPTQLPNRYTWAVGASADGLSATAVAYSQDVAITTSNGGVSWTEDSPVFGGVPNFGGTTQINDVAHLSGGPVAVGGQQGTATYGDVGAISRKSAGLWAPTFRPFFLPLDGGDLIGPIPQPTYASLTSIDAAPGGNVALAVGTYTAPPTAPYTNPPTPGPLRTIVYRTVDGGSTWTTDTATSGAPAWSPTAVTAADADVAYATFSAGSLGSNYFLRRSAAGVWTRSDQWIASGFLSNSLDAYDADHLVVVGNQGKLYYTANASSATPTWIALATTGSANDLYGVQMTGPDSWIVVGGNETIVRFTNAGANQAGSYGLGAPVPVITSHASGFSLPAGSISGTAWDAGVGVLKVEVRIQRALDSKFWNGSTWVADATQYNLASMPTNTTWTYPFASGEMSALTITVRATDGMGLMATTAVNSVGVPPAAQSVTLGTWTSIAGKSSAKVRRSYTVSGSISHAAAPGVVSITMQRKVGRRWKNAGTARVGVSNGSYRYSFKPRYKGYWRFVSTYSGGTSGLTTYTSSRSGTKTIRVK